MLKVSDRQEYDQTCSAQVTQEKEIPEINTSQSENIWKLSQHNSTTITNIKHQAYEDGTLLPHEHEFVDKFNDNA